MSPTANHSTSTNVQYVPSTQLYAAGVFKDIYAEAMDVFWLDGKHEVGIELCQRILTDQRTLMKGFREQFVAETLASLGGMYLHLAKSSRGIKRRQYIARAHGACHESLELSDLAQVSADAAVLRILTTVEACILAGKFGEAQSLMESALAIVAAYDDNSPLWRTIRFRAGTQQAALFERRGNFYAAMSVLAEIKNLSDRKTLRALNRRIARLGQGLVNSWVN